MEQQRSPQPSPQRVPEAKPAADAQPLPLRRSPRKLARDEAAAEPDVRWCQRGRAKWGKYLPHERFNVDQVPMPFIYEMDYTYEEKGAKRVAINQLGSALSKRQCTAQVCFRPEPPPPPPPDASDEVKRRFKQHFMAQPPPCIIFRGTGKQIKQAELDAYPPELVVIWQPKAWVDRPAAIQWAKDGLKPVIEADIAAGVSDASSRYLLWQDNLDAQCQPEYLNVLSTECQTDDHKVCLALTPLPPPALSPLSLPSP